MTRNKDKDQDQPKNVLKLQPPADHDYDDECECEDCCGEDCSCGGSSGYDGMPLLEITEHVLDMLATLSEYRASATAPGAVQILNRTEVCLLRYLDTISSDMESIWLALEARKNE